MLTPCVIVFRLNGWPSVGVAGGAFSGEKIAANLILREIEPELLDARAADFENFDVERDLGARLVVGEHQLANDGDDRLRCAHGNRVVRLVRE